jgi:hypothetical protein
VVGMQVGSGIFSSPGVVVSQVGSVGASLIVWVISGLLAWTGARWVIVAFLYGSESDIAARSLNWDVQYHCLVARRRILRMQ